MNKVYLTTQDLKDDKILSILRKAEREKLEEFIMAYAPLKPRGGEVFLYRCEKVGDRSFLDDQYTGLWSNGKCKSKNGDLGREYFAFKEMKNGKYVTVDGFKKTVFWRKKSAEKVDKIVLIYYEGEFNDDNKFIHDIL